MEYCSGGIWNSGFEAKNNEKNRVRHDAQNFRKRAWRSSTCTPPWS